MKNISLKRILAFTMVAIIVVVAVISELEIESYSIDSVLDESCYSLMEGLVLIALIYVILGLYDLFKDSKKSGILDLLCAGALLFLYDPLRNNNYLFEDITFLIPFIIFVVLSILNVTDVTKKHSEKKIKIDIIISIVLFVLFVSVLIVPVVKVSEINEENYKAFSENIDAIYENADTCYFLASEDMKNYEVLDEKLEKYKSINDIYVNSGYVNVYKDGKENILEIAVDSKKHEYYVYNRSYDKICELKKLDSQNDDVISNGLYIEELLIRARKEGLIDFDELSRGSRLVKVNNNKDNFTDGSEIIYKDGEYYGYMDTDGYRHANEKNEYVVNRYDKYVVTYYPQKNQFEITSKENEEEKKTYNYIAPYDNYMICYKDDHYEMLDPNNLDVLLELDCIYRYVDEWTAIDFYDHLMIYANESVISFSITDEDVNHTKTVVRYDKDSNTAEVVKEGLSEFDTREIVEEYPNSLYVKPTLFEPDEETKKRTNEKMQKELEDFKSGVNVMY